MDKKPSGVLSINQWHPGFFAVLQIELEEERRFLRFYAEYNLQGSPCRLMFWWSEKETDG